MEPNFQILQSLKGNIVDLFNRDVTPGRLFFEDGRIVRIEKCNYKPSLPYIIPGFVDSHVHIESSLMLPQQFSRHALRFGTTAVVADPHEIVNVLGKAGYDLMVENGAGGEIKFYFSVPSCVPATPFDSSGFELDSKEVEVLFSIYSENIPSLGEMMNFPGVLNGDKEVTAKLEIAKKYGKRVDGHCPGLTGKDLKRYIESGISTDHECESLTEAVEKLERGMKIQIRHGSAASIFHKLIPLIQSYPDQLMFCSDDIHPDVFAIGHIDYMVRTAVQKGQDVFNTLRIASLNPVQHYGLDVGLLRPGDSADFLVVDNLEEFNIQENYIKGIPWISKTKEDKPHTPVSRANFFYVNRVKEESLQISRSSGMCKVIEVVDGSLYTREKRYRLRKDSFSETKPEVLKLVSLNRYHKDSPSIALLKNFGLRKGGIISSIAHDSHNLLVTGTSDPIIVELINWVNDCKGGIAVHDGSAIIGLDLPVAGIMSDQNFEFVKDKFDQLNRILKEMGSKLSSPLLSISFLSLLVIPELKLSDRGLFDVRKFEFTSLFTE